MNKKRQTFSTDNFHFLFIFKKVQVGKDQEKKHLCILHGHVFVILKLRYMKSFLYNIIDTKGKIGKPKKYIYMFVITCAELRFVWNIVNIHDNVYTVEKF